MMELRSPSFRSARLSATFIMIENMSILRPRPALVGALAAKLKLAHQNLLSSRRCLDV